MRGRGSVLVPRLSPLDADCLTRLLESVGMRATSTVGIDTAVAVLVLPRRQPPQPLAPQTRRDGFGLPTLLVVHVVDLRAIALGRAIGAAGLLDVHSSPELVVSSVRALLAGRPLPRHEGTPKAQRLLTLTERERDVMALVACGEHDEQIARHLCISTHTVRAHIQHVLTKLDVTHRHAAATLVQDNVAMRTRMWELTAIGERTGTGG